MSMELLHDIREVAETVFKSSAATVDNEKKFDKSLIRKINPKIIFSLFGASAESRILSSEGEAELYFHATKYCASIRNYFLVTCGMVGSTIFKFGTSAQQSRVREALNSDVALIGSLAITEEAGGSDHKRIACAYRRVQGGYIINGKKSWITLGGIADVILVAATGDSGLGLFLIRGDQQGVVRADHVGLICSRGSHLARLSFENSLVQDDALLGGDFTASRDALAYAFDIGRSIAAISAVSLASAALDFLVQYSRKRHQFGVRICDHQLIQGLIAESTVEIAASKLLAVSAFDAVRSERADRKAICAMAKYKSDVMVQRVTQTAIQAVGAVGISEEIPLERYAREAKAFHYIEGTSQVLAQLIARQRLLGAPALWGRGS